MNCENCMKVLSGAADSFIRADECRMGISPQSEKDTILAESLPSAVLVREQLRRLVAHPLFTNSKRYRCYSHTPSSKRCLATQVI